MGKMLTKGKKKGALGRTDDQAKEEERFYHCPKGHRLPHKTNRGNCTPVHCAGSMPEKRTKSVKETAITAPSAPGELETLDEAKEEAKITKAKSRRQARLRAVDFPETPLEGSAAEEFADKELVKLLPEAVAEIKYRLRFGDDDQREKAAEKVLSATGRGKKESGTGGGAIFNVIMPANGGSPVPWLQRTEPKKIEGDNK